MTIGALVVDDQQAVRSALRLVLDAEPDIGVVGEAGNGGAAILAAQETAPDVVLMDIRMPRMDGLAAIREPATTRSAPAEREREVLLLIARGLTNAQIAGSLWIEEGTVKTHVNRLLAKLGLRTRVHAVIYAYEHGLAG